MVRGQEGTKAKEHAGIGFFESGARLSHTIDLRQYTSLLWVVDRKQRFEDGFFSFQRGSQVDQLQAVLLKNIFQAALLIVSQSECPDDGRVSPPLTWRIGEFLGRTAGRPWISAEGPVSSPDPSGGGPWALKLKERKASTARKVTKDGNGA